MDDINAMPQLLSGIMDADQQAFEQDQTARNNQNDRWAMQAEISGYIPTEMSYANNPYIDVDAYGNVTLSANAPSDIKAAIDAARARGDMNEVERLQVARGVKLGENPELMELYGGDGDWKSPTANETAAMRQHAAELANERYLGDKAAETTKYQTDKEYDLGIYSQDVDLQKNVNDNAETRHSTDIAAALTREQMAAGANNSSSGGSSGSKSGNSSGGSSNSNSGALGGNSSKEKTLSLNSINNAINIYNSGQGGNYTDGNGHTLDNNGYKLLAGMQAYAQANGGMTAGEIRQYAVNNSASFNVDKNQFSLVLDALNITGKDKENILSGIVNADPGDWTKGMKFSNNTENTDSSGDLGGMELPGGF